MIDAGGIDKRVGCECRYAIDFSTDGIILFDFFHQQVEVSISRQQHNGINVFCRVHHINGNANVPVALGGAITPLNIGFELYREADVFEGILEFELLVIISMDGIGGCRNDLPFSADSLPEFSIIKLATIGVTGGVVNVLHIGKNCDFLHNSALLAGCLYLSLLYVLTAQVVVISAVEIHDARWSQFNNTCRQ